MNFPLCRQIVVDKPPAKVYFASLLVNSNKNQNSWGQVLHFADDDEWGGIMTGDAYLQNARPDPMLRESMNGKGRD